LKGKWGGARAREKSGVARGTVRCVVRRMKDPCKIKEKGRAEPSTEGEKEKKNEPTMW